MLLVIVLQTKISAELQKVKPGVYCFQFLCELSEIVADCDL